MLKFFLMFVFFNYSISNAEKIIITQDSCSKISVVLKEHLDLGRLRRYDNVLMFCYDKNFFYISRKFCPTTILPISNWSIDTIYYETRQQNQNAKQY